MTTTDNRGAPICADQEYTI